jgi:N4-gp56 family major capsid protein
MQVTQDKGWTFTIDKGNFKQSELVMQAGKACARQIAQVIIPAYDKYVFTKIAKAAYGITSGTTHTHADSTAVSKTNAYELFLKGQEVLGDALVPDAGRVCLCSYKYANPLKQDPAFMRYGNLSQEMILKGILGEIDGVKIVKVPASRLPAGCNFILTHPMATVAPKQLWEYKIHTDAPGISGWLCEGRVLYDAFVLNNKAVATYYNGATTDLT